MHRGGWWRVGLTNTYATRCILERAWLSQAPRSSMEAAGLWAYAGGFLVLMHFFVVLYEEPTLWGTFGGDYKAYCQRVHRWWPGR
jgi:protein-S-isoprenylcysteine O-methyltransferase Ste14